MDNQDLDFMNDKAFKTRLAELFRKTARNVQSRVPIVCDMGMGCENVGICYASAMGKPDRCGRVEVDNSDANPT